MNKYKFYTFTALGLSVLLLIITLLTSRYFLKIYCITNLENEIASTKNITNQITSMVSTSLKNNVAQTTILESIQRTIDNSSKQNSFISIYDWSGKIMAFPDITKVGTPAQSNALIKNLKTTPTGEELYNTLQDTISINQGIVYQQSIPASDWIIAGHINLKNIQKSSTDFKNQMYLVFFIISLLIILFTLIIMRFLSSYFEKLLDQKSLKFEDSVLNIEKLNASLEKYQKNLSSLTITPTVEKTKNSEVIAIANKETSKSRILTYVRNELVPIATEDLAYVYVDNTITYVVRKDGKRATSNESLDQIFSNLDEKSFFRVNRQIIVAISAIDTITKFGNKLKLQLQPEPEIDIFIGKNKAASFKLWLDL